MAMKTTLHIGLSAFNNAYWKGIFYPEDLPRTKWFDFYTQHFSTYELNGTFYRMPTVKSLQAWYHKVPAGFLFSVKVPKTITHFKKFIDCKAEIDSFYSVCSEGLKEKLACVLFQLPPSFSFSEERLMLIVDALDPNYRNVVEFRHESWWIPEVFEIFQKKQVIFCNVSFPKLPEMLVATANTGYIRLHGKPKLFYSGYSPETLGKLLLEARKTSWHETFIYCNNTAGVHGVMNALEMKAMAKRQ